MIVWSSVNSWKNQRENSESEGFVPFVAMKGMNRKDKRAPYWSKKNVETDKPVCGGCPSEC